MPAPIRRTMGPPRASTRTGIARRRTATAPGTNNIPSPATVGTVSGAATEVTTRGGGAGDSGNFARVLHTYKLYDFFCFIVQQVKVD